MVVGGGPAGMEAALTAAKRGHEVTLFEKNRLGGLVPIAAMLKGFETNDYLALVKYYKTQLVKAGVETYFGVNPGAGLVTGMEPDVLILAAGALPSKLEIPGSGSKNVMHSSRLHKQVRFLLNFFSPKTLQKLTKLWMPIGKRVVIIGGSIMGCETAEFLIKRGRKVTIVHNGKTIGDGIPVEDLMRLIPWFDSKGIERFTEAKWEEVNKEGIIITTRDGGRKTLPADTVLVTLPYLPDTTILKKFEGKVAEIYQVGSGAEPGLIVNAITGGAKIGREI
jgi:2,4-dienoyl-CoA reductase (NADPH2)